MHLATRTIPLRGYWMTGGAALPMVAKSKETALRLLKEEHPSNKPLKRTLAFGARSLSAGRWEKQKH